MKLVNFQAKTIQTALISLSMVTSISMAAEKDLTAGSSKSISGTGGIVTRAFTGIWDQSTHESQGTVIQIVDGANGSLDAVIYWFVYDENGTPYWYVGQGPVTNNQIDLTIYEVTGPTFLSPTNPDLRNLAEWGIGSIVFDNCQDGTFTASKSISGTGGFHIPIQKLSSVADTKCAGGTSDALNPSTTPVDIRSSFTSTGAGAGSSGNAEFEISAGRTDFEVQIRGVATGTYGLRIGGQTVGEIMVTSVNDGGELEFRSPIDPGKELLVFDPRGQTIEVLSGGNVILTQQFPQQSGAGGGTIGIPGGPDLEIEIELGNTGVYPLGDGGADFEQRPTRADFSVEIEDVPVGSYDLFVGGQLRGQIEVITDEGETFGELEFRSPIEAGKLLLDFDPRGQLVEIRENGTVIFSSAFSSGGDGDDDTGGGGSENDPTEVEVTYSLNSTGVDPSASGTVEYKQDEDGSELEIEIENLQQDGDYDVFINGDLRGIIEVDDGDGQLSFSDPQDDDDELLDFEPFGATISISLDGVEYFNLTIPE